MSQPDLSGRSYTPLKGPHRGHVMTVVRPENDDHWVVECECSDYKRFTVSHDLMEKALKDQAHES